MSTNQLYHHGVLGMKWGVRRFQNKDGTLTSAGKSRYSDGEQRESFLQKRKRHKQEKRWYSDNKRGISDSENRYGDEYDRTESGKAKLKEYKKGIRKMYSGRDWTDEDDRKFSTTEKEYLKSQQKYQAEKLIKELGEENFAIYVSKGRVERGKDYVAEYIEQWKLHTV